MKIKLDLETQNFLQMQTFLKSEFFGTKQFKALIVFSVKLP